MVNSTQSTYKTLVFDGDIISWHKQIHQPLAVYSRNKSIVLSSSVLETSTEVCNCYFSWRTLQQPGYFNVRWVSTIIVKIHEHYFISKVSLFVLVIYYSWPAVGLDEHCMRFMYPASRHVSSRYKECLNLNYCFRWTEDPSLPCGTRNDDVLLPKITLISASLWLHCHSIQFTQRKPLYSIQLQWLTGFTSSEQARVKNKIHLPSFLWI